MIVKCELKNCIKIADMVVELVLARQDQIEDYQSITGVSLCANHAVNFYHKTITEMDNIQKAFEQKTNTS